ncbi:RDD family protein [Stakelama tenebrarum]|uniref:RDD family protein n=1 Tax=Stakelama tenebrarum TaxID=2711215 RepID=A0A6G6Y7V4_9SPHN|nr:RDD family protein [Sphingosinithalassobacter tenebrarum]QIG80653.1 RDD family protein [Sphingosinithalassobacter tenebrarum]
MRSARQARSTRRHFVTPEGVDLGLDLAGAGDRAAAFLIDVVIILAILIGATILLGIMARAAGETAGSALMIIWLLGFFVLRNAWFTLFELSGRGATPGKRIVKLRVVARDGARLTGGAVFVRNAMREIEIFLPLTFLAMDARSSQVDALIVLLGVGWTFIFLFFPLLNRDRLRVGDMLAGTWVVRQVQRDLSEDLGRDTGERQRRVFPEATLELYGVYELQTLEDVLRRGSVDAVAVVADSIRTKAGLPDDGDDYGFLSDYYAALCARLERGAMLGRRREDKSTPVRS